MNRRRGLGGLALLCAALIASTLSVGVAAGQTTAPEAAVASPGAGTLDWGECPEIFPEQSPDLDCTTMEVPLDHDWPNGRQIEISMLRRPADDQARKLGTIFMNPGGPGGDGVSFVAFVGDVWFTPAVRARYDLVGFDPRGIGSSNPLQCFDSFEQIESALLNKPWPETRADIQAQRVADRNFINACRTSRDPMLNHMSTANVARDLDLLRQAVGDDELHFAGYSYGSMIGANYAALFPDKVGSMIVDGVLDPIAWTTGDGNEGRVVPVTTRVGSHISSQRTLEQYFELCDAAGPARCPFGPDSSDRFDALYDAMKASPLEFVFPTPDGPIPVVLTHQDLIDITLGVLYNSPDWGFFAQDLAFLEFLANGGTPAEPGASPGAAAAAAATGLVMPASTYTLPPPYFGPENALGVLCSDSINPHTTNAWRRSAWTNPGYFGELWGWFGSPCARWPGRDADRYIGPWDIDTENPILVASTRYDPSTPYQGARRVNELFGNTILLTVNGWGHTTPFLSRCADLVVERYLLRGDSRSDDMWCPQDVEPFPEPVVGAGGAAVAAETDGVTTAIDPRGALLDRATTALPGR